MATLGHLTPQQRVVLRLMGTQGGPAGNVLLKPGRWATGMARRSDGQLIISCRHQTLRRLVSLNLIEPESRELPAGNLTVAFRFTAAGQAWVSKRGISRGEA